jgi:IS30 family transposase
MAGHLTLEERDRIAELWHRGFDQQQIAEALNRSPATISRELRRNRVGQEYYAGQAQEQAQRRRRERPLQRKMDDPEINEFVRAGLAHEWSPEQIEGRCQRLDPERRVSSQTIDTWIKQDTHCTHWEARLRRRGKRPAQRKKLGLTGDAARIADRPEVIEQRLRLGDFEGDTVLGPPGTGGLATLVDRKSRFTIVVKIQSKRADHVYEKVKQRLKELDDDHRHSITFDNGTEFARCQRLEKHLGLK